MKKRLTLVLICLLLTLMIGRVQADETPWIKMNIEADGSFYTGDPSIDVPISNYRNSTYTFTSNFGGSLDVRRNNCIIDGKGYEGPAIYLRHVKNITIKNIKFRGKTWISWIPWISVGESSNISIYGNSIEAEYFGIRVGESSNISIYGNSIEAKDLGIGGSLTSNISIYENTIKAPYGIELRVSSNSNICGNTIISNKSKEGYPTTFGIWLWEYSPGGSVLEGFSGDSLLSGSSWDSFNNTISRNSITGSNRGIALDFSHNNTMTENTIEDVFIGIKLSNSSDNSMIRNTIVNSTWSINLYGSSNNIMNNNTFANNTYDDIRVEGESFNNTIDGRIVYPPQRQTPTPQWQTPLAIGIIVIVIITVGIILLKKKSKPKKKQT